MQSYHQSSISSLYRRHELAKKREYGDRVKQVKNYSFTPLVFSTTGGMGREATQFYQYLADQISMKENSHYSIPWLG